MNNSALLKLLYLVSPALPVGAYAYSQGQEFAIDAGWLDKQEKLERWILGLMQHGLSNLDLPCLIRLYRAWQDSDKHALVYWNAYLLASRETSELLLEDEQMGQAMARLLDTLELFTYKELASDSLSYTTLFAYCGVAWSIPLDDLLHGFLAAWLENQVAAATKTVPLGQSQAQKIIIQLHQEIPAIVRHAQSIEDNDIGSSLPGLAIASAKHERQYSRLFRS